MTAVKYRELFDQYSRLFLRIHQVLDGLVISGLLFILSRLYGIEFDLNYVLLGLLTFALVVATFSFNNLYQVWRGARLGRLVSRVFLTWAAVFAALTVMGFITKRSEIYSRRLLLTWFFLTPLLLVAVRCLVYQLTGWARTRGHNHRTLVIGGAGDLGRLLAENILQIRAIGITILGFFDDSPAARQVVVGSGQAAMPVLGDLDDLVAYVREHKVDMVYLALPFRAEDRLRQVIDGLAHTTASVYLAPDLLVFSLLQGGLTDLNGIPLITLWETPFCGLNSWVKRAEDLLLGGTILLCIFPLLLLIALGIKLTSPGPVLFKQRRYGLGGEEILVYKFRTMTVCEDGPEVLQARPNDDRVTPFGRFLRRTSLDELPQFLNVLQGTMSIVGPRPHAVAHNEYYRHLIPGYMLRHKVRPGITGWAQVNGWRGETPSLDKMAKRVEYDLDYLRNWSIWFDLKIIILTLLTWFTCEEAY
jgi:putative colanic acid biosynthesis UDP-glucose lipid carrier transferase